LADRSESMSLLTKSIPVFMLLALPAVGQTRAYQGPRTADGKPDINGIWQAINTADWDLRAHVAKAGHVVSLGAQGAEPGGIGVVEGGVIPYLPEALKTREDNYKKRFTDDPEVKCYLPGVPRATYLPFPFQIVQSAKAMMFSYEFAAASRTIYMAGAPEPDESWMGTSSGHWDGDTLVIDVTGFIDRTWFDRAGDFHSDALKVTERYTPLSAETMQYEATITDPKVYSRPWNISMPLYHRQEPGLRLLEFRCAEFVEELMYGQYRKKTN
jgi:hypothetical protein